MLFIVDLPGSIKDEYAHYVALFPYLLLGLAVSGITTLRLLQRVQREGAFFAVMAGLIAPLFCLRYDFVVFLPGGILDMGLYPYIAIMIGMGTLAAWLAVRQPTPVWCGLVARILLGGFVFALTLGIVLLPYSLLGIGALVSIFGLTPFGTAAVFISDGRRALAQVAHQLPAPILMFTLMPGALLVFPLPFLFVARWGVAS